MYEYLYQDILNCPRYTKELFFVSNNSFQPSYNKALNIRNCG